MSHLPGYTPMVPAVTLDVVAAEFQFLFQLFPQFLRWRVQQARLFRKLPKKRKIRIEILTRNHSLIANQQTCACFWSDEEALKLGVYSGSQLLWGHHCYST